jgi:hypothetical protein
MVNIKILCKYRLLTRIIKSNSNYDNKVVKLDDRIDILTRVVMGVMVTSSERMTVTAAQRHPHWRVVRDIVIGGMFHRASSCAASFGDGLDVCTVHCANGFELVKDNSVRASSTVKSAVSLYKPGHCHFIM